MIDALSESRVREYFVDRSSIVRKIWGKSDTVLFIFAGSAAEFALNKAVDWLYFTGKLPADPIGRLFSTVCYARLIIFSDQASANRAIDKITAIHSAVEQNRQAKIPDWAYRDVLFMLIHYSITCYELLERRLTSAEKEDVYEVFYRVGTRMQLKELPVNYTDWLVQKQAHLEHDLVKSKYTVDLYRQYRKHLGAFRYFIVVETQKLIVPEIVRQMLNLSKVSAISFLLPIYKFTRTLKLDKFVKSLLLPKKYTRQIKELDVHPGV